MPDPNSSYAEEEDDVLSDIFSVTSNIETAGEVDYLDDLDLKQIIEKIAKNLNYHKIVDAM